MTSFIHIETFFETDSYRDLGRDTETVNWGVMTENELVGVGQNRKNTSIPC